MRARPRSPAPSRVVGGPHRRSRAFCVARRCVIAVRGPFGRVVSALAPLRTLFPPAAARLGSGALAAMGAPKRLALEPADAEASAGVLAAYFPSGYDPTTDAGVSWSAYEHPRKKHVQLVAHSEVREQGGGGEGRGEGGWLRSERRVAGLGGVCGFSRRLRLRSRVGDPGPPPAFCFRIPCLNPLLYVLSRLLAFRCSLVV